MKGLYVLELGRARALTELMSAHYFAEKQITLERRFYNTIEKIITEGGGDYNCLYISYYKLNIFLWILSPRKLEVRLRRIDAKETLTAAGFAVQDLDGLFGKEPFREWHFYPKENCEDRSLFPLISNPYHFILKMKTTLKLPAHRFLKTTKNIKNLHQVLSCCTKFSSLQSLMTSSANPKFSSFLIVP